MLSYRLLQYSFISLKCPASIYIYESIFCLIKFSKIVFFWLLLFCSPRPPPFFSLTAGIAHSESVSQLGNGSDYPLFQALSAEVEQDSVVWQLENAQRCNITFLRTQGPFLQLVGFFEKLWGYYHRYIDMSYVLCQNQAEMFLFLFPLFQPPHELPLLPKLQTLNMVSEFETGMVKPLGNLNLLHSFSKQDHENYGTRACSTQALGFLVFRFTNHFPTYSSCQLLLLFTIQTNMLIVLTHNAICLRTCHSNVQLSGEFYLQEISSMRKYPFWDKGSSLS